MADYHREQLLSQMPRIPLHGSIDLTYRCNNICRHCWLWLAENAAERANELTLDEIGCIFDQARALGCREWSISGGEPMLRPDFPEVFDHLTRLATTYSLNTNGTLITPQIAQLLKRRGNKMIALYGATAETYDHVTRHEGGFEQAMRGFRYMQEAGAGFTVQLIPMRDNWHEWEQMQALAKSLSRHWRVGAAWLYMSACGSPARNAEIARQRLDPRDVIALDQPDMSHESAGGHEYEQVAGDDRLFASCIAGRRDFHIDPYGGMTFCCFLIDPAMRYDLRQGTFQDAWDNFIPSLADKVHGGANYHANCAKCGLRADCRWCSAYGYLEHRSYSAPVEYLCAIAREERSAREDWNASHRRFFEIAGVTVQVHADLPIGDETFEAKFNSFRVDGPGADIVSIKHHFHLPEWRTQDMGRAVYHKPPWAIYRRGDSWVYWGITPEADNRPMSVAVFSADHAHGHIYHEDNTRFKSGNLNALTLLTSDQIWLARILADRQACYVHASAAILDGQGLLFVGQSGAGKSTIVKILEGQAAPLCDDRNIVRRWPDGWRVHGSWSHGEIPVVSSGSAPLTAVFFLEKSIENRLERLNDRWAIVQRLLPRLIRPLETADWWTRILDLVVQLAREVPCYCLRFDGSGAIAAELTRPRNQLVAASAKEA